MVPPGAGHTGARIGKHTPRWDGQVWSPSCETVHFGSQVEKEVLSSVTKEL